MPKFTLNARISALSDQVSGILSKERYTHSLGVASAAIRLGEYLLPDKLSDLYVAGLLHDIAKELNDKETQNYLSSVEPPLSVEDLSVPAAFHSFIGPIMIEKKYSEFSTPEILDSVFNHTLGNENMSVFSKIIFLADYIEDGRKYIACKRVAEFVWSSLESEPDKAISIIDNAILMVLENTEDFLKNRGLKIHSRLILTKNSIKASI